MIVGWKSRPEARPEVPPCSFGETTATAQLWDCSRSEQSVDRLAPDLDREARAQRLREFGREIRSHLLVQVARNLLRSILRRRLRGLHLAELGDIGPDPIGGGDDLARFGREQLGDERRRRRVAAGWLTQEGRRGRDFEPLFGG